MLWGLGLAGNAFKKVYYDPALERQVSLFVPAEDMVVPYGASNLETAERITHVMRKTKQEIHNLQEKGFYKDIDLGEPDYDLDTVEKKIAEQMGFDATNDDRYKILEMNVNLDLEGYEDKDGNRKTGIALPYVVTIDKGTTEILAIRRNWNQDDMKKRREHFVHYGYIPGFGFYCFGLIHLIGGFSKSGTMLLRQLVDAGTLSNLPGGFKARGLRIKGDDTPIGPAEWRDVDAPSGTIRDNLMPLPYKEPSQVLAALMDKIIDEGRRFASAADMKVSDMSANSPVGSTLAILERTLKVMSAVNARIYYSMKKEFGLLKTLIRDYTDPNYQYDPSTGTPGAKQADYDKVALIPVADPNAATMAQKVVQYQAVMQMAQQNPDIYDLPELNRQMLDVLGVKNAEKLIPNKDDVKQLGPVTENMNIINGKPVKAFLDQDHKAHIAVHMAFTDDPLIRKLVGQSTKAGMIQAAMEAHIAEHIAFQYRLEIENKLGVPLPPIDEPLPIDIENEVARLTAEAAPKVLGDSSLKASEEERQQQAQDPVLQMQQAELQIKQEEAKVKAQKTMADIELDKAKLELDRQKATVEVQKDVMLEQARIKSQETIKGADIGAKAEMQQKDITTKEVIEGAKLGAQAINKEKDIALRSEESRLRNETIAHTQKLRDRTEIKETKDEDNTN
jgi:hypothetical protein